MNKRGRKTNGLSHRLIALLLCCVCLLTVFPLSAIALAPDETTLAEAEIVPVEPPTEDIAAEPEISDAESEEDSAEQRAVNALYEQLMACTSYAELEAALNGGLNEDELYLMNQFTAEQRDALETRMNELSGNASDVLDSTPEYAIPQGGSTTVTSSLSGYGYSYICKGVNKESGKEVSGFEVRYTNGGYKITVAASVLVGEYTLTVTGTAPWWSDGTTQTETVQVTVTKADTSAYTFTVTPTLSNVDVVYFAYHTEADVTDNIEFSPVKNGTDVEIADFSYNQPGYVLFFVKPEENYLLTSAAGSGNNDIYSVAEGIEKDFGNIKRYPEIKKIAEQAKANGYIGVLGYSKTTNSTGDMKQSISLHGQSPDITVTATFDKTADVKPGDALKFTVTITPGQIAGENVKVENVTIESLEINGKKISDVTLTSNGDGTYTATVPHTATQEECDNGSVKLTVTAKVSYSNTLGVTDGQTLDSEAAIVKSATATCRIAPQSQVSYRLTYQNADGIAYESYPDEIKRKPNDVNSIYLGTSVTVNHDFYEKATVDDPTNHGTWTFGGWYYNGTVAPDAVTMGEDPIEFVGTWTFTPYPNAKLTIRKTLSGNMQNANTEFQFTVTAEKAMTYGEKTAKTLTFQLKKDENVIISVPVGVEVSVSEEPGDYTYSLVTGKTTIKDYKTIENGIRFTMPRGASTVVFNNEKNITIDAGIILETLPYTLMLAVVVGGVAVTITRRKHRRED